MSELFWLIGPNIHTYYRVQEGDFLPTSKYYQYDRVYLVNSKNSQTVIQSQVESNSVRIIKNIILQDKRLYPNATGGILLSNQSLVIQVIKIERKKILGEYSQQKNDARIGEKSQKLFWYELAGFLGVFLDYSYIYVRIWGNMA